MSKPVQDMQDVNRLVVSLQQEAARRGFALRGEQDTFCDRWYQGLTGSAQRFIAGDHRTGIVLAEAGTGLGKTLGYLLPLMAFASVTGARVAVATHTHLLQRQIMAGDLARVNDWLEAVGARRLTAAQRMGRQAFLSKDAVEAVLEDIRTEQADPALKPYLKALLAWLPDSETGLIEDALIELGDLPEGLTRAAICLNVDSPVADEMHYEAHLARAAQADLTLVTHHHLAALALYSGGRHEWAALVIDEADQLVSAVTSMSHHEVSLRRLRAALEDAQFDAAVTALDQLIERAARIIPTSGEQAVALVTLATRTRNLLLDEVLQLQTALAEAGETLRGARSSKKQALRTEIKRVIALLRRLTEEKYQDYWVGALSYSPTRHYPSLSALPLHPGRELARLWRKDAEDAERASLVAVLLTSATLGTPGKADMQVAFRDVSISLGVGLPNEHQLPLMAHWGRYHPDKFGQMRFVLADPAAGNPVSGVDDDDGCALLSTDWLKYASRMIARAQRAGGRTLVLTRSYRDNARLAEILPASDKLIIQEPGQMSSCRKRYMDTEGAVWISPSAWEGVDLPGMVQNLMVFRIPLQPDDALTRALLRGVAKKSEQDVNKILHARRKLTALRLMNQGLGRGIRCESDRCTVWIPDPRFPAKPDNKHLLALPPAKGKALPVRPHAYLYEAVPVRFRKALENDPRIFAKEG